MNVKFVTVITTILLSGVTYAVDVPSNFDKKIQAVLNSHYNTYKDTEYFSGAALSIYTPNQSIKNYYIGSVSHDANSKPISHDTLFEIGSITKSFTAVIMLQLEKENKLKLSDTLKQWLPEYEKWSAITLQQLLNMSSGLPNYSDSPLWNAKEAESPEYQWTSKELIHFSYPPENFSPPLKTTYFYSNTGYVLSDMIVEKITGHPFGDELESRTIENAHLDNTFYPAPVMDDKVKSRLASGYGFNQYDNPELVGKDVQAVNLTWAGAAGAVVSNSEDVIKWIKALFIDNQLLDATQKKKLTSIISTSTNKPIKSTSLTDPRGFGLGVVQAYDKKIGQFWFYEGETLGYRALYLYVPCSGIIISSIFNSATNSENDHGGELMKKVYQIALGVVPKSKSCGKI